MTYDKNVHHRRSIRLKDCDYSSDLLFFVTICAFDKKCIFGKISNNEINLSNIGKIAEQCLLDIPKHFPDTIIGEYVIMPNHIHFILGTFRIHGPDGRRLFDSVGAQYFAPCNDRFSVEGFALKDALCRGGLSSAPGAKYCAPTTRPPNQKSQSGTLGSIIKGFKIGVTKQVGKPIFQRNYYEHIIRNNKEHDEIIKYIANNPENWITDSNFIM